MLDMSQILLYKPHKIVCHHNLQQNIYIYIYNIYIYYEGNLLLLLLFFLGAKDVIEVAPIIFISYQFVSIF